MEGHRRSVKEQAGEFGNPELWRADSLLSLFSRECERPGQLPHGGSVLCISQDLYTHFFVPDCARACEISGVGTPPGKWQNTGGFCAKSPSQCCQKFPRSACIIPAIAVTNGDIQQMELMFGVSVCGAHTCVRVPCASCVQPVSLGKDNQRSLNKPASVLSHHMEAVLGTPAPPNCEWPEDGYYVSAIFVPSVPREEMCAQSDDKRGNMGRDASRVQLLF